MKKNKPSEEKLDYLLDKISKYGLLSLTNNEIIFLDSYASYTEDFFVSKIEEDIYEDFNGRFKFEFSNITHTPYSKLIHGKIYVPDLKLKSSTISGILTGYIIITNTGDINLFFKKDKWDIWDFCTGLEWELDVFIDSVIIEIDEKRGFKI